MKTIVKKLVRNPVLVVATLTAGGGVLVAFEVVQVTAEQSGKLAVFAGILMALVRYVVTPSSEVVAQVKPDGTVVAGDAAVEPTGTELAVDGIVEGDESLSAVMLPVEIKADRVNPH